MFGKKKCKSCGEKLNEKYSFCPYCGAYEKEQKTVNKQGILGEDDYLNEINELPDTIFGGIGARVMGKMFENAMRLLEKEMEKEMRRNKPRENRIPKTNFQLFINGKKVNTMNNQPKKKITQKREITKLPQNILKKFSKLPQKDPKTNVRRLSDKVIYEINIPGVKSLKDISIVKLENNIEIKAISKDNAYKKMIPVNYPITDYNLDKEKLILEFDSED